MSQDTSIATQNYDNTTYDDESNQEIHMGMSADEVSANEEEIETKKDEQELESTLIKQQPNIKEAIDPSTDLNFGIHLVDYYTPMAFYDPTALIPIADAKQYHLPKENMTPVIEPHLLYTRQRQFEEAIEKDMIEGWILQVQIYKLAHHIYRQDHTKIITAEKTYIDHCPHCL